MPIRMDDLDKAIAKVIVTCNCEEEISAELREIIVNYVQRKDILAVLPTGYGKSLLFQLLYLVYAVCEKGVGRQHTTFASCQNAAGSNEFFL